MDSLLINLDDFIFWTDLSKNIEEDRVKPHILDSQIRLLASSMCNPLYDEVLEQFDNDSLTADNATLLKDYVKPFLVFASYQGVLLQSGKISTPTGMVKIIGDDKEQVTREELNDLMTSNQSKSDFYQNRMISFLSCNLDKYPLFSSCCKVEKAKFNFSSITSPKRR